MATEKITFTHAELVTTCYALHQTIMKLVYHALSGKQKEFRKLIDLESFKMELQAMVSVHGRLVTAVNKKEKLNLEIPDSLMGVIVEILTAPVWDAIQYHDFDKHDDCSICKLKDAVLKEGTK